MNANHKTVLVALVLATTFGSAYATNGTMFHGYGARAQGMGGVGIGYFQDSLAGANNPAGFSWIDDRADIELSILKADRGARINGRDIDSNGKDLYVFPMMGWKRGLDDAVSLGISVYPMGAGTVYEEPVVTGPVTSPRKDTEAELAQVVFAPSVSYRLNSDHSIGVSLNLAYQRFYAQGTEPLYGEPGTDSSWGAGLALGWAGKLHDRVTVGLSYHSRINMGKLDRYDGLLANRGEMDIPERYGLGISAQLTDATTIAFDYLRINYGGVKSLSNSVYAFLNPATPPGSSKGPGFGWKDQDVFKIGVNHKYSDALTLRAGYSHATGVIPARETALNYLAQITPQDHYTLGATLKSGPTTSWTVAYGFVPKTTVKGRGMLSATTDLYHQQHWLSLGYSW